MKGLKRELIRYCFDICSYIHSDKSRYFLADNMWLVVICISQYVMIGLFWFSTAGFVFVSLTLSPLSLKWMPPCLNLATSFDANRVSVKISNRMANSVDPDETAPFAKVSVVVCRDERVKFVYCFPFIMSIITILIILNVHRLIFLLFLS